MRVYVPKSQIESVSTPDYVIVEATELEKLLGEEADRRKQSPGQSAGIREAFYVCRLDGDAIFSERSRWRISADLEHEPLELGPISVALRPNGLATSQTEFLLKSLRYLSDGRAILTSDAPIEDAWFGFSSKAVSSNSRGMNFHFELPPAVVGTMLLSTPSSLALDSPNVPWNVVFEPRTVLPADWPQDSQILDEPNRHWYLVSISGQKQFDLQLQPAPAASSLRYDLQVRMAELEYTATRTGIGLKNEFRFNVPPSSGKLILRSDRSVRVRSVRVNGLLVQSNEIPNAHEETGSHDALGAGRMIAIELPKESSQELVVQVEAFAAVQIPAQGPLPMLSVFRGYVMNGRASLSAADGLEIEDLQIADSRAAMAVVPIVAGLREQPLWRWSWQGEMSPARASIGYPGNQIDLRTLNKIAVHPAWISADSQLRLIVRKPTANQIKLRIGSDWFVDSVAIVKESSRVTSDLTPSRDGGNDLTLRWEKADQNVEMDISIAAHNPTKTDSNTIRIASSPLITLPGALQHDSYIVETSGQFQLQIDPELLHIRTAEDELQDWQRALLPRLSDAWILRGTGGTMPPLTMRRMRGTYTTHHTTAIHPFPGGTRIRHRIVCQPVSGSIAQVLISMPATEAATVSGWTLVRTETESGSQESQASSSVQSTTATETVHEITLPVAATTAFAIEAEVITTGTGERIDIALPSVPQSVGQDGLILMPEQLCNFASTAGLEVLPARACCADDELISEFGKLGGRLVACRYDPNELSNIEIRTQTSVHKAAWAWQQRSIHWLATEGKGWHEIKWLFMVPEAQAIAVSLPGNWTVRGLVVDGQQTLVRDVQSSQRLVIDLRAGDSIEVALTCNSEQTAAGWLNRMTVSEPSTNVRVLSREEQILIPPTKIPLASLFEHAEPNRLIERLQPKSWWRWLRPDPWSIDSAAKESNRSMLLTMQTSANAPPSIAAAVPRILGNNESVSFSSGWTMIPAASLVSQSRLLSKLTSRSEKGDYTCWLIDRAAVGAIALAAVLFSAMTMFVLLGTSVLRWWTALIIVITATIAIPGWLMPWMQLILLALAAASITRFAFYVLSLSPRSQRQGVSRRGSTITPRHASILLLVAMHSCLAHSGHAQSTYEAIDSSKPEIFSVLIPVQDDRQLSGDYVYVPSRLQRMLSDPLSHSSSANSIRIIDVLYSLQIASTSLERSTVSDFSVEIVVEFLGEDMLFRFPLLSSEAQLLRGFVNGQELLNNTSLRQEAAHIVWRAPGNGQYKLRLSMLPKTIRESDGRTQLSIQIPPFATARMEVRGESTKDIEVTAIGQVKREPLGSLTAEIGPTRQLNVSWPLRLPRQPLYSVPQVFADSWIHIQNEHVIAQCQLRITGASSVGRQVHVECDSSWEPVGTDWNDVVVLSSSEVPGTNRIAYALERTKLSNETATIRVLMLPKNREYSSPIAVPILSLRENSSLTRTLAYSVLGRPGWMLSGTEKWQPLPDIGQAVAYWGDAKLSEQPTMLRVPLGTISATLVRQPVAFLPSVDETTEVHFRLPETTLRYEARWQPSANNPSALRLQVPSNSNVVSVRVNDIPIRFNLVDETDFRRLIAFQDIARGRLQLLQVELAMPMELNRPDALPRVWLEDTSIQSSTYRLLRGAELSCKLESDEVGGIDLNEFQSRAHSLLPELEFLIGETLLPDALRQAVPLPLRATLKRATTVRRGASVMRMIRTDTGWVAKLETEIDTPDQGPDFFLVDAPVELRDSYETATASMTLPSAETSRMTLCVVPPAPINGKTRITITSRLPTTGSSQSIRIPDIRVISISLPRPALALPQEIEGGRVRWTKIGRSVTNRRDLQWFNTTGCSLFENSSDQRQVSWRAVGDQSGKPRVLLARSSLTAQPDKTCSGLLEYWVDPRNQNYLTMTIPKDCELFGAMIGDQVANWQRLESRQIQILMQPSYLPLRLRVLVRWDLNSDSQTVSPFDLGLALPLLDAVVESPHLIEFRPHLAMNFEHIAGSREITRTAALDLTNDAWQGLIDGALPIASNRPSEELSAWLSHWNPRRVGITKVTTPRAEDSVLASDNKAVMIEADTDESLSVDDVWKRYLSRFGVLETGSSSEPDPSSAGRSSESLRVSQPSKQDGQDFLGNVAFGGDRSIDSPQDVGRRHWLEFHDSRKDANELVVRTTQQPSPPPNYRPWIAASMLLLVGLFGTLAGNRLGAVCIRFAEANPWLLWIGLASVAWWWLPVVWPGYVLGVCAVHVFVQSFVSRRQRSRHF